MDSSIPSFFTLKNEESRFKSKYSYSGKCVHQISGVNVEVNAKWWPADSAIQTIVVFVPGNPGVIEFYDSFLEALHLRYKGRGLAILAHGMLGHAPQLPTPKHTGLLHQIESLFQILQKIRREWTQVKVVVISHSVGAWVATQTMKLGADIDAIFGLFPALSNLALTPRGRQLSWIFQKPFPQIIILLTMLLYPLVPFLVKSLFNLWPSRQREVLISIIRSPGVITSCFTMAREEMDVIRMPDERFLREHPSKLWLYYGSQDHWVGTERERIIKALGHQAGLKIVHCKHDIPHSFCILHGELLAEQCGNWLDEGKLI